MSIRLQLLFVALLLIPVAATGCASRIEEKPGRCEVAVDSPPGIDELLTDSVVVGPQEARLRRHHALAGELARTFENVPGVECARVHLALAEPNVYSRGPVEPSSASVALRVDARYTLTNEDVRRLVEGALPQLVDRRVEVLVSRSVAAQESGELVDVGPLALPRESARTVKAVLVALVGLCGLLAIGLIVAGVEIRRLRRRSPR